MGAELDFTQASVLTFPKAGDGLLLEQGHVTSLHGTLSTKRETKCNPPFTSGLTTQESGQRDPVRPDGLICVS